MCGFGMWSFGTDFVFIYVIDGTQIQIYVQISFIFALFYVSKIGFQFIFSFLELPKEKMIWDQATNYLQAKIKNYVNW